MTWFEVSQPCLDLGLRAGAIAFEGLRIAKRTASLTDDILRFAEDIRQRFSSLADLRRLSDVAHLREIHRQVGSRPGKQLPSVESLYKYVLKRGDLPSINNLVDAYNLVSLRTRCSMGAHDLDKIAVPVALQLLDGREQITPLGSAAAVTVQAGEFGYVDAKGRLICRLDVVQADFSKVTTDTSRALMIVEATTVHAPSQVQEAFDQVIALVTRECGGSAIDVIAPSR